MTVMVKPLGQPSAQPHVKSREMMIRELCNRVYQLLFRCVLPRGKTLAQLLAELESKHHQYLFDRIYKHIHTQYFNSLNERAKNPRIQAYLIEEQGVYYLRSMADLWRIFDLLGLASNYQDIPYHLRKSISRKAFERLIQDIPRSRILYEDRYTPTPYHFNRIETTEFHKKHPDGQPIPFFVKHVYVHKIFKFHGSCVKIWEFVPQEITKPTPVCLVPGFGSNYYSFHFEGNQSIDYHLVRCGSRVFVLDHERKDADANIDVFTEYLTTTMIDFVRDRTGAPQVILGGHSMGGMISIFKAILDGVRRPRFVTSTKALFMINTPIHFDESYFVPDWFVKAAETVFDVIGRHGTVPVAEISSILMSLPFIEDVLCMDGTPLLKKLQKLPLLEYNQFLQWLIDFQINPFSTDPQALSRMADRALTNPPRMVLQHLGNMIKQHGKGIASYNYDELLVRAYDHLGESEDDQETFAKQSVGINYTDNLYRISGAVPLLTIQAQDDMISPPRPFYKFWGRWAHLYKLRLDHDPHDPQSEKEVCENIAQFIEKNGLSTAIGLTVTTGKHMGCLQTAKQVLATFVEAVENFPFSPFSLVKTGLLAQRILIQRGNNEQSSFIAERDLAKKIRYIDPHLFWTERQSMVRLLLDLLSTFQPKARIDERFHNFMVRDRKKIEQDSEDVKYNVLHNCVQAILGFKPDPLALIQQVLALVSAEAPPPAACFRSLIDLSLGLFDLSKNGLPDKHQQFLKPFEDFLNFSVQQVESSIALHAVRAFFHTRDEVFIQKGGKVCQQLPEAWRERAYQIYWEEMQQRIGELQQASVKTIHTEMKAFMQIAKQIAFSPKSGVQ